MLLELGINQFSYNDLYNPFKLCELTLEFDSFYKERSPESFALFEKYRYQKETGLKKTEISQILIDTSRAVESFIIKLFGIEKEAGLIQQKFHSEELIMRLKREFIKKGILKKKDKPEITSYERYEELSSNYKVELEKFAQFDWKDEELGFARLVTNYIDEIKINERAEDRSNLELLEEYYFLRRHLLPESLTTWITSQIPDKLDFENLVEIVRPEFEIQEVITSPHTRRRNGFALTDKRDSTRQITSEIEYCLICHEREKDSCSTGMNEKDGSIKKNPLGIDITGCPLDERISEMHSLKEHGYVIGALAMVVLDNPMCAGTGHRICNDCMKGCIFQKQDPVNIPQIETSVLTDVLNLPWGFEIYGLLTRWNPLNINRPYALPYNGKKVMVVGLGPAGYTLSHYLLNEGFAVVGIDGLKIEPFPVEMTGSENRPPVPIYNYKKEIEKELNERVLEGFGGVSEYGITVRWDKNFLTVLHLLLYRRNTFTILDGVRFGGTITIDDAWELGFDHIALATGAGKPTIIDMKNNLSRGIRKASDFLMALQLTGAAKYDSLANLQINLPAIVIGGGLTAIDTATEALAYYPVQVEKFVIEADELKKSLGENGFHSLFDREETILAQKYYEHGKQIIAERKRAEENGEIPNFLPLLKSWGGVKLVYRKRLQDAPAYRLNHEEVHEALEEGIEIVENMVPLEAKLDEFGAVKSVLFERTEENTTIELPAGSVFIAAGTSPNITYEKEYPATFELDRKGKYFRAFEVLRN
ncbi:MAG: FAD-dependent oxidoreductase [Ignavibacteriae bacterium]|nr:FAD-dependent oxidoreductase [Ignavibacteriota bacterium]